MSELRLEYLFEAYVNNKCSGREEEELMTFLSNPENEEQVQNLVDCFMENGVFEIQMSDVAAASMLNNILKKEQGFVIPKKNSKIGTSFWLGLAASVLIILGGIYTISVKYEDAIGKQDSSGQVAFTTYDSVNILPGANRVVLTTTDGHTIILDSAQNWMLTQQGDTRVKKQDASLPYNLVLFANGDEVLSFNTLFTTRRGQYQIVLLHGCDVWLNAASSIRFSTVFSSLFCEVELTGEAYFEVFKNKKKAFQVAVGDVKIAVLRTYFNVKAYEDDTKTT